MKTNLLFVMTLLAPFALAQQPAPCSAAENRQFDFWVGEWNVTTPAGKQAGTNSITRIANGCALLEQWTGASGFNGKSLNAWDAIRKKWHQTWVDSSGKVLYLDGELRDGKMVLAGRTGNTLQRITWTPLPNGDVRQFWEQSKDEGQTWTVVFDGLYKPRSVVEQLSRRARTFVLSGSANASSGGEYGVGTCRARRTPPPRRR